MRSDQGMDAKGCLLVLSGGLVGFFAAFLITAPLYLVLGWWEWTPAIGSLIHLLAMIAGGVGAGVLSKNR